VHHGGAGDGPAAPSLSAVREGGVRSRVSRCGVEPALGLGDGRGSPGGLAHGGGELMKGNRWCWLGRGVDEPGD
jgi:hypothetical protein